MLHGKEEMERCVPEYIPRIVCLCGSTRFKDAFFEASWKFALEGEIVLSVGVYRGDDLFDQETIDKLNELHLRKIDLADHVFVLNVGGYVGEGLKREIAYAEAHNKPISYLEPLEINNERL